MFFDYRIILMFFEYKMFFDYRKYCSYENINKKWAYIFKNNIFKDLKDLLDYSDFESAATDGLGVTVIT